MRPVDASSTPRIQVLEGMAESRKSIVMRLGTAVGVIARSPAAVPLGLAREQG
jgi:hypothetical protein